MFATLLSWHDIHEKYSHFRTDDRFFFLFSHYDIFLVCYELLNYLCFICSWWWKRCSFCNCCPLPFHEKPTAVWFVCVFGWPWCDFHFGCFFLIIIFFHKMLVFVCAYTPRDTQSELESYYICIYKLLHV